MNKVCTAILTTLVSGALFASVAYSAPMVGDTIKMSKTSNQYGVGGEFLLSSVSTKGNEAYSYITFCLERDEYFGYNTTYMVDSVVDYAQEGGINGWTEDNGIKKDYISNATKWLINKYTNYKSDLSSFGVGQDLARMTQNAIWYFEEEYRNDDDRNKLKLNNGLITHVESQFSNPFDYNPNYLSNVFVFNISDDSGFKQSQGAANPVPEPATMLLFGAGLAGLAGLARRRKQAS